MFIVNQNETEIVNIDNLIEIQLDDNVIWGISNVGKIPLGDYETDERAKEVFNEMLKVVFPTNVYMLQNVKSDFIDFKINDFPPPNIVTEGDTKITRCDIGVWYMPE